MNKHKSLLCVILIMLVAILFLSGCLTGGGTIKGMVYLDGNVDRPLANIDVTLVNESFEEIATMKTDSEGQFIFTNIDSGEYRVSAFIQDECFVLDLANPVTITKKEVVERNISLPCTP